MFDRTLMLYVDGRINYTPIVVKQKDTLNRLKIIPVSNSEPYKLTNVATARIKCLKPDKNEIDNEITVDKQNNCLYATLTEQMLLLPGNKVECEIVLHEAEGRLTTGTFYLDIRKQVHDSSNVESKSEYKTFENAIQKLSTYESRLAQTAKKTDISSPYNYKGACTSTELSSKTGMAINDTWYLTDLKMKKTWNGTAWGQSSLNEADYQNNLSEKSSRVILFTPSWKLGSISSNGLEVSSSDFYIGGYIRCYAGDIVSLENGGEIQRIRCYSDDKTYVNLTDTTHTSYIVPDNVEYVRLIISKNYDIDTKVKVISNYDFVQLPQIQSAYTTSENIYDDINQKSRYYMFEFVNDTIGIYTNVAGTASIKLTDHKTYMRVVIRPKTYTAGANGTFIGLSPTQWFDSGIGFYFYPSATYGNIIQSCNKASRNTLGTFTEQDYTVHIFYDKGIISCYAVGEDGTEYYYKSVFSDLAYLVFKSNDTRGSNGNIIKSLHCNNGNFIYKSSTKSVMWSSTEHANFRIYFPQNFDTSESRNAIICYHGNGTSEASWSDNQNMTKVQQMLVDAGYIVVTATYKLNNSTWGSKESTNAYYEVYKYLINNFKVNNVGMYGNSMGGIESLNSLSERRIPAKCWCGTAPTYDLDNNHANATFTSTIEYAYGATSETYNKLTNGRNPAKMPNYAFGCVPMLIIAGDADAAVNQTYNGFKLYDDVLPVCDATKIVVSGGGHSFDVNDYATPIIDFYNKWLS